MTTKTIKTEKKANVKSETIILNTNVQKATNELIALSAKGTNINLFSKLSAKECILLNSSLRKKKKHFFPQDIADKNESSYRGYNRNQLNKSIVDSFEAKTNGTNKVIINNLINNLDKQKAIRNFILAKYNVDILTIDIKTFDYNLIYDNENFKHCAMIQFKIIQDNYNNKSIK